MKRSVDIRQDLQEKAVFETFVSHYRKPMITLAFRMVGNREDAEDIVQEAFVRFWRAVYSLEISQKAFSLISRITMNLCIDSLRKKRWRAIVLPFETIEYEFVSDEQSDQRLYKNELKHQIEKLCHWLKPRQKACFVMRDVEDRSIEEIAGVLGCSENNVKVNLCLARKNMRKWLKPFLKDEA